VTREEANRLGEFIKAERLKAGLSLRQLAEPSDISFSALRKIEEGTVEQPSPGVLQRLSRNLGCDYEDLASMAGYSLPEGMPNLPVYLRTKYDDLTSDEIKQMEAFLGYLRQRRSGTGEQDGNASR
jgi:transcriptional regulator with XRE-family HTH domain